MRLETTDALTLMRSLEPGSVTHIITDPPYQQVVHDSMNAHDLTRLQMDRSVQSDRNRNVGVTFDGLEADAITQLAREFARVARRWVIAFSNIYGAGTWDAALTAAGLKPHPAAIWLRLNPTPRWAGDGPGAPAQAICLAHGPEKKRWSGGGKAGLYTYPTVINRGGNNPRLHPTQKPVKLMAHLITDFTDPGDTILDPFMGSGTTGVAAAMEGRDFIGTDTNPEYVAIASKRIDAAMAQGRLF